MIPNEDHLKQKRVYAKDGKGLWRVIAYCDEPTIRMKNIVTNQEESFGISGLTARRFSPIPGIKVGYGEAAVEVDQCS